MKKINMLKELKLYALLFGMGVTAVTTSACSKQKEDTKLEYYDMTYRQIIDDINKNGNKLDEYTYFETYYRLTKFNTEYMKKYFTVSDNAHSYDVKCNLAEYSEMTGNETVTYEDLKQIVLNNSNLNEYIKQVLITGLDNLSTASLDIDLSALKYNLTNLKVKFVNNKNSNLIGRFDIYSGVVVLDDSLKDNDEYFTKTLLHEVIGHGLVNAYREINGKKVLCTNREMFVHIDYVPFEDRDRNIYGVGDSFDEGFAELITSFALGEKIDCNNKKWTYSAQTYQLLVNLEIAKMSLSEYANTGLYGLLENLGNNGYGELINRISGYDMSMYGEESAKPYMTNALLVHARHLLYDGHDKGSILAECARICDIYSSYIIPREPFELELYPSIDNVQPTDLKVAIDKPINDLYKDYQKTK